MKESQGRRPLGDIITEWWQALFKKAAVDYEESRLARFERAAKELGFSTDELLTISLRAYYTTDLLPLRMALLHLDADETARKDPTLFRALATNCKLCDAKGQCGRDMVQDPANPQWQRYCPNAVTLGAMRSVMMQRVMM